MKLTEEEARQLAKSFRDFSVSLGDFRFGNWADLSEKERKTIEGMEWKLLNYSSDFTTKTVGLILDDAEGSLKSLQQAAGKAKKAIANIKTVKNIIIISTSIMELGVAVASKDPKVVASAVRNVVKTVNEARKK
ncbi:MAG: hypothetical protein V1933_02855 [Candidatus Omnitrophota bacterium]